jgi:hypothetical protein
MKHRHCQVIVVAVALASAPAWSCKRETTTPKAADVGLREFSEIDLEDTKDGCQVVDKTTRHKAKPGGTTHWRVRNDCNAQQNVSFTDWKLKVVSAEDAPCSWQDPEATQAPPPFATACDLTLQVPAGQTRQRACQNNKSGNYKGCHPYRIHLNGTPQPDPELVIWP